MADMSHTISSSTCSASAAVASCRRTKWSIYHRGKFTCHAQQNSSQRHPARLLCLPEESDHVGGIECRVDLGVPADDVVQADRAHAEQPGEDDRREEEPYAMGAVVLEREQEY